MSDQQRLHRTVFGVLTAVLFACACFAVVYVTVGDSFVRPFVAIMVALALYYPFLKVENRVNPYA